ncbi:baseplate protein [Salmonella enterica subsp. salamae]|uniref:Baseplate protein n=1 Tax=Salmonella enterica subsp. salamae TaxID=59202 RepID=A0A6D2GFJ5_SALER|nr:baseplate protein [Salmonella enterica subsp. salamae]
MSTWKRPTRAFKALNVTVDAPLSTFTGDVTVMKKLTWLGGMAGSGGNSNHHSH